jgi:hypothetical protein
LKRAKTGRRGNPNGPQHADDIDSRALVLYSTDPTVGAEANAFPALPTGLTRKFTALANNSFLVSGKPGRILRKRTLRVFARDVNRNGPSVVTGQSREEKVPVYAKRACVAISCV